MEGGRISDCGFRISDCGLWIVGCGNDIGSNFFLPNYLFTRICILYLQSQKGGAIAQSVEQWTENPCVLGSIPSGTT